MEVKDMKEKILNSVHEGMAIIKKEHMSDQEIRFIIGAIGLGVECVLEHIEDDLELRGEIQRRIINDLQDMYIKDKNEILYWEDMQEILKLLIDYMQLSEKLWRKEQYGRLTEKEKRMSKKLDEWSNKAFERILLKNKWENK